MCVTQTSSARLVPLPESPTTASPVPWLTSLYYKGTRRGEFGHARYPGNCGGELIEDLLRFFGARRVLDPMSGSGTCREVCCKMKIECHSSDIQNGIDACDAGNFANIGQFDFVWLHPPYWRMKRYSDDPRDLSTAPTLGDFLNRYETLIRNCASVLAPKGKLAVLMGNYHDREEGYVDLVFETKRLCRAIGLRQNVTDIIRFSHGTSSSRKVYRTSFIPGLHDVCMIFERLK